jgi:hypothetical protein
MFASFVTTMKPWFKEAEGTKDFIIAGAFQYEINYRET